MALLWLEQEREARVKLLSQLAVLIVDLVPDASKVGGWSFPWGGLGTSRRYRSSAGSPVFLHRTRRNCLRRYPYDFGMPQDRGAVNQHYVPQVYLKRFTIPGDTLQVHVLDKPAGRLFISNTRNIASERYFYDVPGEQPSERALAELETAIDPVLGKLIGFGNGDIPEEGQALLDETESDLLSMFIALLDVRTAPFRQSIGDMRNEIDSLLLDMASRMGIRHQSVQPATENDEREDFIAVMWQTAAEIRRIVRTMRWTLLLASEDSEFITSDHPLVKQNFSPPPLPWMGNLGWTSDGLEVFLPISSQVCLGLLNCDKNIPGVSTITDSDVRMINRLVTAFAHRFLFAGSERPLRLIQGDLATVPGLRESRLAFGARTPLDEE